MLRSIVIGWILMQRNWSILLTSFPRKCLGNRRSSCELLCIGESSPRQLQTFVAPIRSLELSWNFKLRRTSQIFAVKVVTRQNLLWKIRKYNSRRSLAIKCSLHLVTTPRLTWDSVYWDQNIFFLGSKKFTGILFKWRDRGKPSAYFILLLFLVDMLKRFGQGISVIKMKP